MPPKVNVEAKILNNKINTQGRLGSSKKRDIVADWKKLTKKGKKGKTLQEMREFLIGEGYHPDDIEEMVSMTRLDADEFEETFGLLDVEDEYEEMEKKKKNQEPSTINIINPRTGKRDTSRLGKKGKGTVGMNPSNLDYIRTEVQGKSSSRNKGLSKADEKKISGCVALGVKVVKRKGPPMYPHHDCTKCCKKFDGQLNSLCNDRCNSKYDSNNTFGNVYRAKMIANKIRKKKSKKSSTRYQEYEEDAYEFGEENEYEEMNIVKSITQFRKKTTEKIKAKTEQIKVNKAQKMEDVFALNYSIDLGNNSTKPDPFQTFLKELEALVNAGNKEQLKKELYKVKKAGAGSGKYDIFKQRIPRLRKYIQEGKNEKIKKLAYRDYMKVIAILKYFDPIKKKYIKNERQGDSLRLGWLQAKRYRENSLKF